MKVNAIEIAGALVAYAGPLDDPRIGWTGASPSHRDLFQCERCGAEHLDCSRIQHKPDCSALALLKILEGLRNQTTGTDK